MWHSLKVMHKLMAWTVRSTVVRGGVRNSAPAYVDYHRVTGQALAKANSYAKTDHMSGQLQLFVATKITESTRKEACDTESSKPALEEVET